MPHLVAIYYKVPLSRQLTKRPRQRFEQRKCSTLSPRLEWVIRFPLRKYPESSEVSISSVVKTLEPPWPEGTLACKSVFTTAGISLLHLNAKTINFSTAIDFIYYKKKKKREIHSSNLGLSVPAMSRNNLRNFAWRAALKKEIHRFLKHETPQWLQLSESFKGGISESRRRRSGAVRETYPHYLTLTLGNPLYSHPPYAHP